MFNVHIFINEIQRKYRGVGFWVIGMMLYSFMMILLFDSFADQLEEMVSVFGDLYEGILAAFSSSAESLATFEGFFSVEYISFGLIIGAIYGAYLGVSTVGKEISNKTIAFLLSKPVSRLSTYISKFLGIAAALAVGSVILCISNVVGVEVLSSKAEVAPEFFITIYAALYFYILFFVALGQGLAVVIGDGKALGISVALSVGAIMLNFMRSIDSIPNEIQYLNPQYYVDVERIGETSSLPPSAWLLLVGAIVITLGGALWYKRRDVNV